VVADGSGNILIGAGGGVREVDLGGTIRTVLPYNTVNYGSRTCVQTGVVTTFFAASGLAFDRLGNLYVSDYGVRRLAPGGTVTTIAGTGTLGYSGDGGPATSAQVNPGALAMDGAGNVYLADPGANVIRILRPAHPEHDQRPVGRPVRE
jgi:sugar lactone lactonase YvrE